MTYAQIYAALDRSPVPPKFDLLSEPFAAKTALSMLLEITGLPLIAISYPKCGFSSEFPKGTIPDSAVPVFGRNLRKYQIWRNLVLDCELLAEPGQVDSNPWDSTRRLAKILLGKPAANTLGRMRALCSVTLTSMTIDRTTAIAIDKELSPTRRNAFRNGLRVLDLLQGHDLARGSGLLPEAPIGRLPKPSAHSTHAPLPPRLKRVATGSIELHCWISALWRVAVLAGLFRPEDDPCAHELVRPETYTALRGIDPQDYGIPTPGRLAFKGYVRRLATAIDPDGAWKHAQTIDPIDEKWIRLRRTAIDIGVSASRADLLSRLARKAKPDGLPPTSLSPRWISSLLARLPAEEKALTRRACYLIDDLRDVSGFPIELLPPEPTGIVRLAEHRRQKRAEEEAAKAEKNAAALKCPVEQTWIDLFARAREAGIDENRLHALYALKRAALRQGLRPQDMDQLEIEGVLATAPRSDASKIRVSSKLLDELRSVSDFEDLLPATPIGPLTDRRRSADDLRSSISDTLEDLLYLQGGSDGTRRGIRIAIRALAEVAERRGLHVTSLDDLLKPEIQLGDWGKHEPQKTRYEKSIRNLQAFRSLPWTDNWRKLQEAIVTIGISPSTNPLPGVLKYADGLEPEQLTLSWARAVDRALRRPNELSRHGRADLARTFTSNLAKLDALDGNPTLKATGLLPPPIGRIR